MSLSFSAHAKRRAQISVEYLVIVGIAIALLLPGIYFFYVYSKSTLEGTTNARLNDIGLKMVSNGKSTYALGNGARQTLEFIMPEMVTKVNVTYIPSTKESELIFVYDTPYGPSEAVFFTNIMLTNNNSQTNAKISDPHAGITKYRFISNGQNISIVDVES